MSGDSKPVRFVIPRLANPAGRLPCVVAGVWKVARICWPADREAGVGAVVPRPSSLPGGIRCQAGSAPLCHAVLRNTCSSTCTSLGGERVGFERVHA